MANNVVDAGAGAVLAEYMTVANLQRCETVFMSHMAARHPGSIADMDSAVVRRTLYGVMRDMHSKHERQPQAHGGNSINIRELNNLTLNVARDIVMGGKRGAVVAGVDDSSSAANNTRRPNVRGLDRDKDVFGDRSVTFNTLIPAAGAAPGTREIVNREFEAAVNQRQAESDASGPAAVLPPPVAASSEEDSCAIGSDEFQRRLAALTQDRDDQQQRMQEQQPQSQSLAEADPQAFARAAMADQAAFQASQQRTDEAEGQQQQQQQHEMKRMAEAAPPPRRLVVAERYLGISGSDRDWVADPYRYLFTVRIAGADSGDLQHRYRNVAWVEATHIVLPMEITQVSSALSVAKSAFQHEYSFQYQYVVLNIDGMDGAYDGTNETLRRAFCMFMYHRNYKAPNGRGYVMLEPMQNARRVFLPAPLAQLRDLRVSILKPNGTLFNNSTDGGVQVSSLEWNPTRRLYMRVVCDRYFEKNEFYVGDMVRIADFASAPDKALADITKNNAALHNALAIFVNRRQGHEVVELGAANEQGFIRDFYVLAPGVLDQGSGRVLIDEVLVALIQTLSATGGTAATSKVTAHGRTLNMSLQAVVTLRVGVQSDDATSVIQPIPV